MSILNAGVSTDDEAVSWLCLTDIERLTAWAADRRARGINAAIYTGRRVSKPVHGLLPLRPCLNRCGVKFLQDMFSLKNKIFSGMILDRAQLVS